MKIRGDCRLKVLAAKSIPLLVWTIFAAVSYGNIAAASGLPETIGRIKASVVGVGTYLPTRRPPGKFTATGFVVADGQHALTNAHSIPETLDHEHKERLVVLSGTGGTGARPARVVGTDDRHDLALIRFDGTPLPPLVLADSQRVREGELYAFTGYPIGMVLGMRPVTHRGIISAITPIAVPQLSARSLDARTIKQLADPYDVFQLDATAYPGNSGSPLYDVLTGEVVGVINKVFVKQTKENVLKDPSGITYAIPISYATDLLRKAGLR